MKLNVINEADGRAVSELDVADAIFGVRFNEPLVHQVVVAFQTRARQGTRAQKGRAEVRGGGRKPWRQKGTGQARAGTIRSPLWRGGGKTFPASPDENFNPKVNRKMHRGALCAVLSELVRQGRLMTVNEFSVGEPKTKALAAKLAALNATDALIVTGAEDRNLSLASRNLHSVDVRPVDEADVVSLMRHDKVIMTAEAVKKFVERLA